MNEEIFEKENKEEIKKESKAYDIVLWVMFIVVVATILIGLSFMIKDLFSEVADVKQTYNEMKETRVEKILLTSTVHDTRINGRFTYGYGRTQERDYFVAYRVLEDGAKHMYKMEAEKTYIYNTLQPGEQAYVDVYQDGFGRVQKYHLYVPEDAIEEEFNLSLSD